jgi:hypothetical protein
MWVFDEVFPECVLGEDGVLETEFFPVQRPNKIQVGNHGGSGDIPDTVLAFSGVIESVLEVINQLVVNKQVELALTLCKSHGVGGHTVLVVLFCCVDAFSVGTGDGGEFFEDLVGVHFGEVFGFVL